MARAKIRRQRFRLPKKFLLEEKIVLAIILICMGMVIGAIIFSLCAQPESSSKSKFEAMAKDYYENYFYQGGIRCSGR